jgi:hypothetical protein
MAVDSWFEFDSVFSCQLVIVRWMLSLFFGLLFLALLFGTGATNTGYSPPRMSPGLRPPRLFRCGEYPVFVAPGHAAGVRLINDRSQQRSRWRGTPFREIKEEAEGRGTFEKRGAAPP